MDGYSPFPIDRVVLGLGGQRCGSTWLHEQLCRHPGISTARDIKEMHFFDRYWSNGADWYRAHFTGAAGTVNWESTPYYLYAPEVPERIAGTIAHPRFVVLLRDPLTRSRSQYHRFLTNSGQSVTFAEAILQRPEILRLSRYAEFLPGYLDRFGAENIFVGFYEEIATDPAALVRRVTEFMGLEPLPGSQEELSRRINAVPAMKHPRLHAVAERGKRQLLRMGLGGVVRGARQVGLRRIISAKGGTKAAPPPMTEADVARLVALREEQVTALAALGIDAGHWRDSPAAGREGTDLRTVG